MRFDCPIQCWRVERCFGCYTQISRSAIRISLLIGPFLPLFIQREASPPPFSRVFLRHGWVCAAIPPQFCRERVFSSSSETDPLVFPRNPHAARRTDGAGRVSCPKHFVIKFVIETAYGMPISLSTVLEEVTITRIKFGSLHATSLSIFSISKQSLTRSD